LLDTVEKEAMKAGFTVINLDVRETMTAAIQLYESRGYELLGRHPYYAMVGGAFVEGRYYTKRLLPA
jgi:ribosomal protein S18 acetylase RimI-like enzyme